jgi:NAD(P)-dependent dehydrogenase (short-subunit alcohol dehydrogenase family)
MTGILDLFRLDGRVAVVTGSGRGIGRGIALALAEAGADVLVTARREGELERVAGEIRARGRKAAVHPGDLRAGIAGDIAERAVEELGRLDAWVNNAGGADDPSVAPLADITEEKLRSFLELNLVAAFSGVKAALRHMGEGSSIVNIASGAGMRAAPNTGAYGASKAALLNLTATLAAELAPRRIRVNAVSPGMIPTESFLEVLGFTDDDLPDLARRVPLGRLGTPEDIGAAVVYLCSPAASWMTGQNLFISGGREGGRSVEDR